MVMRSYRYEFPGARDWSRWDEVKQRFGNMSAMLWFAWVALRMDSATFAIMLTNSVRDLGDGLISVVMKDGREID